MGKITIRNNDYEYLYEKFCVKQKLAKDVQNLVVKIVAGLLTITHEQCMILFLFLCYFSYFVYNLFSCFTGFLLSFNQFIVLVQQFIVLVHLFIVS
jgi:hypothetical protein